MRTAVKWYGGKAKEQLRQGAVRGLAIGAEHVLEQSKRLVPFEEGTLERSGVASSDPNQLRACVSYDTPYAVVQHEDMTMQHDVGRQAKYLETPITDPGVRRSVETIIAREITRELGA
jgi:hypothetical protein